MARTLRGFKDAQAIEQGQWGGSVATRASRAKPAPKTSRAQPDQPVPHVLVVPITALALRSVAPSIVGKNRRLLARPICMRGPRRPRLCCSGTIPASPANAAAGVAGVVGFVPKGQSRPARSGPPRPLLLARRSRPAGHGRECSSCSEAEAPARLLLLDQTGRPSGAVSQRNRGAPHAIAVLTAEGTV
jgi:hypothetical protein